MADYNTHKRVKIFVFLDQKEETMKKAFLLALVFCLSLSLFAGGSSDKKAATTETGEVDMSVVYKEPGGEFILTPQFVGYENAEIELSWQPNPSQSLTSPIQARVDDLSMKLEKWVKAHPNVKINIVGTTSNINDNMTKLRLSVVEGGAPDLCAVDSFMMPLFLEYARDVSDVAAEKGIDINDYFPYVKEQVMVGDEMRAIWYTTDTRALFYRKDLIDTPPYTADEVIEVGKEMAAQGLQGFLFLGGRGEGSVNNLWGLFWSQGGELVDEEGNMAIDKEPNKTYLINLYKFVKRCIDEGVTPVSITSFARDANMFGDAAAGNVAMFLSNTSAIGNMRELIGKEKFNELWGMAPTPVLEEGLTSTASAGGWTNMVFSQDELHRKLAADLAFELYSTDEAAYSWLLVEGSMPTQAHQYELFDYISSDPYFMKNAEFLENGSTRPAVEIYNTISTEAQVALGNVITGADTPEHAVEVIIENVKNSI